MKKQLARTDPEAAKKIFDDVASPYDKLLNDTNQFSRNTALIYSPYIDSMTTALNFIQTNTGYENPHLQKQIESAIKQYKVAEGELAGAEYLKRQLTQRQQYLQDKLKNHGLVKEFRQYQEQIYYYRAQLDEYKNIFEQPKKLEASLLKAVKKIPSFRNYFNKYSQLSRLFRINGSESVSIEPIPGLQTRNMVMQDLDQRLGNGATANQTIISSIQEANSGLGKLKEKYKNLGNAGEGIDMPDFKPRIEKTKSFFKRLEFGTNIQSTKSNSFFPVTTDFGLSVGYSFSPKTVAGVGVSYKMGWGRDIKHISISHEGVGLRTFADIKLKKSIWIAGGGELNYRSRINNFPQLKTQSDWQRSAMAGLVKKYKISSKMKGNLQVIYDFLYLENYPASPPVVLRMGYSF